MKFKIKTSYLLNNLIPVSKAVSRNIQMPVLTGIKFDVKKDTVVLSATNNSELSIQAKLQANEDLIIEETGTTVISANLLLNLIKKIEEKWLNFSLFEEKTLKIYNEKGNYSINQFDPEYFPNISFIASDKKLTLSTVVFKDIIKKTTIAASDRLGDGVLTGVNLTVDNKKVIFSATDSYRLSRKIIDQTDEFEDVSVVIPAKSLEEVGRILEDEKGKVELFFKPSNIIIKYKNIHIKLTVIEGKYPKTDVFIPKKYTNGFIVKRSDLLATIERMNIFIESDSSKMIKIQLNNQKVLEFNSSTTETGGAQEKLEPIEVDNDTPFIVAFSAKYFHEAIKIFDSELISLKYTGEVKPFVFTSDGDENFIHLVLPMRRP